MADHEMSADARAWFVDEVIPRIRRACKRRSRHIGPEAREEYTQEAVALAWKRFRRGWVKVMRNGPGAWLLARQAAYGVLHGKRCASRASKRDLIDGPYNGPAGHGGGNERRCDIKLLADVIDSGRQGPDELAALHLDWESFLRRLSPTERSATADLAAGRFLYEVAQRLGINPHTLKAWREEWWQQWVRLDPSAAAFHLIATTSCRAAPPQ